MLPTGHTLSSESRVAFRTRFERRFLCSPPLSRHERTLLSVSPQPVLKRFHMEGPGQLSR